MFAWKLLPLCFLIGTYLALLQPGCAIKHKKKSFKERLDNLGKGEIVSAQSSSSNYTSGYLYEMFYLNDDCSDNFLEIIATNGDYCQQYSDNANQTFNFVFDITDTQCSVIRQIYNSSDCTGGITATGLFIYFLETCTTLIFYN